eukprot:SAG11_NODE_1557_length_4684_cov_3.766194_5_plen_122_part_00
MNGVAAVGKALPRNREEGNDWTRITSTMIPLEEHKDKRQRKENELRWPLFADEDSSTIEIVNSQKLRHEMDVQCNRATKAQKSKTEPPEAYVVTIQEILNRTVGGSEEHSPDQQERNSGNR